MHERYDRSRPIVGLVGRDIALREPLFQAHSRRGRIAALVLLACMAVLGSYLFFRSGLFISHVQDSLRAASGDTDKIRIYNQQLESLQGKMAGFIADSVETKLRTLEKSVAAGTVGTEEFRTFEELKSELKLLETYSLGTSGNGMDQARLDHQRFQVLPGSRQTTSAGDLMREVLHLQNLFYLGIASCGMIGLLVGGYWWQHEARHKRLHRNLSRARLLTNRLSDE